MKYYRIDNSVEATRYTRPRPKGSLGPVVLLAHSFKVDVRDDSLFVPSEHYATGYFKLRVGEWLVKDEMGRFERYGDEEFWTKFCEDVK